MRKFFVCRKMANLGYSAKSMPEGKVKAKHAKNAINSDANPETLGSA